MRRHKECLVKLLDSKNRTYEPLEDKKKFRLFGDKVFDP
jgi:hypothetical protein